MSPITRHIIAALAVLLATGLIAPRASSQIGIESVFKEITDVSFTTTCWRTLRGEVRATHRCPSGSHAFGFDISYRIRSIPLPGSAVRPDTTTKLESVTRRRSPGSARSGAADSLTIDSVFTRQISDHPTGKHVLLELGLGYSQISGFRSASDQYELRGAVREIPAVTFSGTFQTSDPNAWWHDFGVYAGLRTGLIQFRDFQAVTRGNTVGDTVVVFATDAQSFQLGPVAGAYYEPPFLRDIGIFLEYAQMFRRFPSVRWGSGGRTPAVLPRTLDFSGGAFSLGVQIGVKQK
jgi:hypothetical protein